MGGAGRGSRPACLTAPAATGTAGTVAGGTNQACAQYRYSAVGGANTPFAAPADQVYVNQSLYAIRVGVRFSF